MISIKIFAIKTALIALLGGIFVSIVPPLSAQAAVASDFRAGNIINDGIFFNSSAMNPSQIQAFLNAKVPACDTNGTKIYSGSTTRAQYGASRGHPAPYTCLKDYVVATPSKGAEPGLCNSYGGGVKSSAQIIYEVGLICGVNPQVLLVLLQKEQSLLSDEWPWPSQYDIATGYACPDTAPCDAEYFGFFNQVYHAARVYKRYARDAGQYNYVAGRNNNILYHPNAACGSSPVFLYNQATAGLYNYTPYQPNGAALANLYGTGDGCSAYGNRNFWRMFYDWFGSTSGGVSLLRPASDTTVYVLYGGQKQGIPSGDVLNAWGLQSLPITVMDDASANVIPTRPALTRLARNPHNNALFLFADRGGTYDSLANMVANWGYNPNAASPIGGELVAYTSRLGGLSSFVTADGAGAIFAVDGATKRAFSTGENFQSWAKNSHVNLVSSDLLAQLPTGPGILSHQAQAGSTQYILNSGRLLALEGAVASLYPRNAVTSISTALADVLPRGGPAARFVRGSAGTIYLVDNGTKHGIASLGLLLSYAPHNAVSVTQLSDAELAQIPDGQPVTTRFAYVPANPSKQRYINHSTYALPTAFAANTYGFGISDIGLSLVGPENVPISCTQGLVQAAGSPGISILDNGVRRGIASLDMLAMIKNDTGNVCVLSPEDVNVMPLGAPISPYASNNGTNYLLEQNSKYTISPAVATSIGAGSFTPVSDAFIANYGGNVPLTTTFRAGGQFVMTDGGKYYGTPFDTIAGLWGISLTAPIHSPYIFKFIPKGETLIPFARSTNPSDGAIYLVDSTKFLPIASLSHLFNAGFGMQQIPAVSPGLISANLGPTWHGYLARHATNDTVYVLEGGRKHAVPANLLNTWLGTTAPATPTLLSQNFLSRLPDAGNVTRSVETGAPGIYGINDGMKAGIPNLRTFNNSYAPSKMVSGHLIESIPWGPPIPAQ